MKKLVVIVAVLAVAAGGYWWFRQSGKPAKATPVLHGNVDIREVTLGFRVSGRLQHVSREEGDAVKAGEVLARLDETPYQLEVAEAKAQVGAARAQLALLETGYRAEEVAQAPKARAGAPR